jgi:glycine/D-amino acid oxidase-like deaminating enzyme
VRHDTPTVPPPPAADELLARVRALVRDTQTACIEGVRIGIRPLPADGHSIVGWTGEAEGFYVVVTHSGVTLGPLLGELVAAEVLERAPSPMLAPFRPERFRGV